MKIFNKHFYSSQSNYSSFSRKSLCLIAIALCILSACASRTITPELRTRGLSETALENFSVPIQYPVSTRRRLLSILEMEWRDWGQFTVDQRDNPVPEELRGPVSEYSPDGFSKIYAYWSVLRSDGYIAENRRAFLRGVQPGNYNCGTDSSSDSDPWVWGCQPWSAAFISYVMTAAGIGSNEFPPHDAHRLYVDGLIRRWQAWRDGSNMTPTFVPHDPSVYSPTLGDLVCSDRTRLRNHDGGPIPGARRISTLEERILEIGSARPMHCDIVWKTGRSEIEAIGGNVNQSVASSRFRVNSEGRIQNGGRTFFVVFQNMIGIPPR